MVESSYDGINYKQMWVFHLQVLGDKSVEMGRANPPLQAEKIVRFGFYACSPSDSSFRAEFCNIKLESCKWLAHGAASDSTQQVNHLD
ncbi:MAG: regulation of enolase protein 1 (concanavalin A-like superfamily) [Candidatus Azotimanducaceae bacterium]